MNPNLPSTLVVIRHGESDANKEAIISNKAIDHPLTDLGIAQAESTAILLQEERFDVVISSTRQRALVTAQIVNKLHNAEVFTTDDLIERDYGIFSGVCKDKAHKTMTADGFGWMEVPESETSAELDARVNRVVEMISNSHSGKRILISTHEDVIRSFYRVLGGMTDDEALELQIDNATPHRFSA